MKIILSPQRRDDQLVVTKSGEVLTVNGFVYDFSPMGNGDTLPRDALNSEWFAGDVDKVDGELVLTLLLPNPWNYSQAQAFPVPLLNVPDGPVVFPEPNPVEENAEQQAPSLAIPAMASAGVIDWSKLITAAMKATAAAAEHLAQAKADLTARNARAVTQIARIQDRVDTIGFGIDIGEATAEDEAEQAALLVTLKAWKKYKFDLGKVTTQPTWYQAPAWPTEPPIPEIVAAPMLVTAETV